METIQVVIDEKLLQASDRAAKKAKLNLNRLQERSCRRSAEPAKQRWKQHTKKIQIDGLFFSPFRLIHLNTGIHSGNPLGESTMTNKKRLFVPTALLLVSLLGVSVANAQSSSCPYTLASLQGNYAITTSYGASVAMAIGTRSLDGNGNMTGTFRINEPTAGSTTGARTIVTGTQVGTYTVNCNGTGQFMRTLTQSSGTVTTSVDDFIITSAVRVFNGTGMVLIATTIVDAQQAPSAIVPGGVFVTRTHNRLPN